MQDKIFRGISRCQECGSKMSPIKNNQYLCANYNRSGSCSVRNAWSEFSISQIVLRHAMKQGKVLILDSEHIKEYVKEIYLGLNDKYKIIFNDGSEASWDNKILKI